MMKNARFSYRILAMALAFLLIFTSVPVVAFADAGTGVTVTDPAGTTTNPSGSQNDGDSTQTTPVEPGNASELETKIKDGGLLVLDKDYEIDKTIQILNNIEIDLNGHTITYTNTGAEGGYYVFEIGEWDDVENRVAPTVTIRDTSAARTGMLVSTYTGVLSLVHGKLNIESGYFKAANSLPVLRLNSRDSNDGDLLTVYDGRFDGSLPQTYDGRFMVYGGMFDNPNVSNLVINSIFTVRESEEINGVVYYIVSVGVGEQDRDEIMEWYLAGGDVDCQDCIDNGIIGNYDLVIHNVQEYVWFARLVAEGAFTYNGTDINATDDTVLIVDDITFTDELYIPVGSERAPFAGTVIGAKAHTLDAAATITVPVIDAVHAGVFGYVTDFSITDINVEIGEVKNVANIMGENTVTRPQTTAGAMVGNLAGNAIMTDVGALCQDTPLVGVVATGATLTMNGPVHETGANGEDVAPEYGFIDTAELYADNNGTVVINGGFYSFELDPDDVPSGLARTRETINRDKVYNVSDPNWYSVTDIGNFVAMLVDGEAKGDYGYFETFQAALDAVDRESLFIHILADITDENVVVEADKIVIVYFYDYDHTGSITVEAGAKLHLVAYSGYISTIINQGEAEIDVEAATFDKVVGEAGSHTALTNGIFKVVEKAEGATMFIDGGFFKSLNKDNTGYTIVGGYFTDEAKPLPEMADGKNGYAVVVNTDEDTKDEYPWTISNAGNEARVDVDGQVVVFQYLEEAMDYVLNGNKMNATITLLDDVTLDAPYKTNNKVVYTIDLGGYTLTAAEHAFIITAGEVTFKNGTIAATYNAIWADNTGSATCIVLNLADDLTITSVKESGVRVQPGKVSVIVNTSATIITESVDAAAITVTKGYEAKECVINVLGGKITAAGDGIYVNENALVNITGVEIDAENAGVRVDNGQLVITDENGVVIDGAKQAIAVTYIGKPIDVEINGGTFNSDTYAFEFAVATRSFPDVDVAINGGVFNAPVVSNGLYGFVYGGYFVEIDRNLVNSSVARSDVADYEIDGKFYYSIHNVFDAYLFDEVSGDYVAYQYLESAIYNAGHGATVYIARDLSDKDGDAFIVLPDPADPTKTITRVVDTTQESHISYSIQLDRCVNITSYDPNGTGVKFKLENISFDLHTYLDAYPAGHEAGDAETHYSFTNLQFVGNAHIHFHKQQGASNLTIDNCDANVTDGAFLFAWDAMGVVANDYELMLTLTLTNNTIIADNDNNEYNYAVEVEATLCDGTIIANNTFGSVEAPYTETFVFKAFKIQSAEQNNGVRATIKINNNTVHMSNGSRPASAFEFAGSVEFLMVGQNNTILTDHVYVEGELPARIAMYSVGQNGIIVDLKDGENQSTIDGKELTLQNVYYQPGQKPKYVGVRVELVEETYFDYDAGEAKTDKFICGGIFDRETDEIYAKLARSCYLLETVFPNLYQGEAADATYFGYVVTTILGDGTFENPYVIPNDLIMQKVLYNGVEDKAYYLVGEGVDADLIAAFVADLQNGIDSYTGEVNDTVSVAYVYTFEKTYEGFEEEAYVKYGYKNLEEALGEADGKTVTLLRDLTIKEELVKDVTNTILLIDKASIVLNMADCFVDLADVQIAICGGMLTIFNLGATTDAIITSSVQTEAAFVAYEGGSLVIGTSVYVEVVEDDVYAILVKADSSVNIKGAVVAVGTAIYAEGGNTAVTVEPDAMVQSTLGNAIHQFNMGTVFVNGGEIFGTVEINAGNLIVLDGYFSTYGNAAIIIKQLTADESIFVDIRGGQFESDMEALLEENDLAAEEQNVTMTITGGTFWSDIYSENCTGFINDYDVYFVDYNYADTFVDAYGAVRDNTYMPPLAYFGKTADGVQLARSFEATLIDGLYMWTPVDAVALYNELYYSTMYEALNDIYINGNADDAYTVTLIKKTVEPLGILIANNVTIDMANFTATIPAADPNWASWMNIVVNPAASLTVNNGTLTLENVGGYDAQVLGTLVLNAVTWNGNAYIVDLGTVTLQGATTINSDIYVLPYAYYVDGTNSVLNVNDENVTVNGDVLVFWQIDYQTGMIVGEPNTTGKAVINISAGTFNGTVRLVDTSDVYFGGDATSDNGFVGNITGGYFAFPEDATYKPNNALCNNEYAFAVSDKALAEGITTDSGRTTYYTVGEAVAQAEFYTIMSNDGDATVWIGYATLEEALEAMSDTGNVRLFKNITLDAVADVDVADIIKLDLAGYTLTISDGAYINLSAGYNLTLINSKADAGLVDAFGEAFYVTDNAILTIADAIVNGVCADSWATATIVMVSGGQLHVKNATVTAVNAPAIANDWSDTIGNTGVYLNGGAKITSEGWSGAVSQTVNGKLHIADAYVKGGVNVTAGELKIWGAKTLIEGENFAINISVYEGGYYDEIADEYITVPGSVTVDITGGTFKGYYSFSEEHDETANVQISIRNENGTIPMFEGEFYATAESFITGGAFKLVDWEGKYLIAVAYEHLVDGYWPVFSAADGYYYIKDMGVSAVAEIDVIDADGNAYLKYVATINDAINGVMDGYTINILRDSVETFVVEGEATEKTFTIDLNGKTLAVTEAAQIGVGANVIFVNGTLTTSRGMDLMTIMADKAETPATVTFGYGLVATGVTTNYGTLILEGDATVETIVTDIADRQTTNSHIVMDSADALISDTLYVGRTNPYRNAGVPYIDMTAGNIFKLALLEHADPEIYQDPTYSYDVPVGENNITGGYIGIESDEDVVKLFVSKDAQFSAFATKYMVYTQAAEGEVATPEILFTDLVVGSGLEMNVYFANVADANAFAATVNDEAAELVYDETTKLASVTITLSALEVGQDFAIVLTDAEGNAVLDTTVCFVDAAIELMKGGDAETVNLILALLNYANAFVAYYAPDDWTSIIRLAGALYDTAYENGAMNDEIAGTVETVNGNTIYTITNGAESKTYNRVGLNKLAYKTYGRVGVTPNVIFNDKFDLVLDFKFEKKDVADIDLSTFSAVVTADKEGFEAVNVQVVKATNASGVAVLRVVFEDISAMDLDVNYTVTLSDGEGTMAYTMSIASYMAERMQNDTDDLYKDLMKALYLYHLAAEPFGSDDIQIGG